MFRSAFLGICIIAISIVAFVLMLSPEEPSLATLVVLDGRAVVYPSQDSLRLASDNLSSVQAGQVVTVNAENVIQLGPGATAQLKLLDGSTVDLSEGAQLEISELSITNDSFRVRFKQFSGKTLNRVLRILGTSDVYEIITPSSTISVRGTVFVVQVIDENTTYVACYEGVVHVITSGQEIDVPAGEELTSRQGEPLFINPLENLIPPTLEATLPNAQTVSTLAPTSFIATPIPSLMPTLSPAPLLTPFPTQTPLTSGVDNIEGSALATSPSSVDQSGNSPVANNPYQVPGNPPTDSNGKPPEGGADPPGQGGEPPGQQKKK